MENRISARKAHSIASGEYENLMSNRVEEFLDKVYKQIRYCSENGLFYTSVDISIDGENSRNRISDVLKSDGYKVGYYHRKYDDQDYVNVSWKDT